MEVCLQLTVLWNSTNTFVRQITKWNEEIEKRKIYSKKTVGIVYKSLCVLVSVCGRVFFVWVIVVYNLHLVICLSIVVCKASWNLRLQTNFHDIKYINLIYIYSLSLLYNSSNLDTVHTLNYIALGSQKNPQSELGTTNTVTIYI